MTSGFFPQELAGYTGGDVSFLKEDFELQLNKPLMLDSVSLQPVPCLVGVTLYLGVLSAQSTGVSRCCDALTQRI